MGRVRGGGVAGGGGLRELGDEDCDGVDACAVDYPWSITLGGVEWENGRAVGFDGAGNVVLLVYASGKSVHDLGGGALEGAGGRDIAIAKFAPDGAHLWSQRYTAPFPQFVDGTDLAVHADGRIAVTGSFDATLDFGGGPIRASSRCSGPERVSFC